ncbi:MULTISPECIES: hypothetical protein [unclassified Francisella]|uniref:hypothetical protein n=1 Tax=unclassified Francisella TaxID=2610885 RepID=UPI002E318A17|nr:MULTISPECIES: hypothetical protein [unclassified Francisella]MED7819446.1 hypothetical protein [Francisella sp. 19S2-4]MED7830235.1 hypothetical protein [Francisella sp. 19S2-10]
MKMNNQSKEMYYKSIYFDLPFLIFVKDGFKDKELEEWFNAYKNKKDLPYSRYAPNCKKNDRFIIGSRAPVYIPSKIEKAYIVKIYDVFVGIQFLRRITQNKSVDLCGEIEGDRTGRASFSSVRINFDLKQFDIKKFHNTKYFINLAIEAVNKFIEHYRVITGKFYIRSITPAIIQEFFVFDSYKDNSTITKIYVTDKSILNDEKNDNLFSGLIYHMDATMRGMGGSILDKEDLELRQVLDKDIEPSIIKTLQLEVEDKLDLREWRLAAIESAVLFETFLNIRLRDAYKKLGLSDAEIENKFHKNDRHRTPLSSYKIAELLVKDALGFDFSLTSEFREWCRNTKDLRNEVVHGKKYKVTKEEAVLSYDSVKKSISVISGYL